MVIIVDGPDGSGKTTLIEKLSNHFKYKVKKDFKRSNALFDYLDEIHNMDDDIIWDRFHFGEYVYPLLKKNENRKSLTFDEIKEIELNLLDKRTVLVLCMKESEKILKTFLERGENYVNHNINEIENMRSLYFICFNNSILPKIIFDYEKISFDSLINLIEERYNSNF